MAQNYGIKVDLLKLQGAFMRNMTSSKTNVTKRCVCVPVDDNDCVYLGEKGCYLNMSAFETPGSQFGNTHMVKPDIPKEQREQMTDEQKMAIPVLGNMRPMQGSSMPVSGTSMVDAPEGQGEDDLPF